MENNELIQTDFALPLCRFICRENGEFVEKTTRDLFYKKRAVVFGLPGAFTPTCTTSQVPDYEAAYDDLIASGVDEVYCVSVNDAFVMNAWRDSLGVKKVKFLPDGNGFFTRQLGMNVFKTNLGFGIRSWRYAMVINADVVEVLFAESGRGDNCEQDPYENSKPEKVLSYLKEVPRTAFDPDENSIDSAQKLERLRNEILGGIKQE